MTAAMSEQLLEDAPMAKQYVLTLNFPQAHQCMCVKGQFRFFKSANAYLPHSATDSDGRDACSKQSF